MSRHGLMPKTIWSSRAPFDLFGSYLEVGIGLPEEPERQLRVATPHIGLLNRGAVAAEIHVALTREFGELIERTSVVLEAPAQQLEVCATEHLERSVAPVRQEAPNHLFSRRDNVPRVFARVSTHPIG